MNNPSKRISSARHYLAAFLAPVVIAGVMQATWPLFYQNPVSPYLLAVVFCSWYGGFWPGMLSLVTSFLVTDFFFIEPYFHFLFPSQAYWVRLLIFAVVGPFICIASELMHRANRRANLNLEAAQQGAAALQESEAQFRTMANSIPQLAWMARPDGYIYWYNQRWHDYTGTTPEQMEGWGWQSVHDPAVLPKVMEKWQRAIATGQPLEMEFPLRGADGSFRQFLTRVQPMVDSQDRVTQWLGTNTDVDELKQMEVSLRETREQLALFVEHAPAAIAMFDCNMNYLAVSNRWLSNYAIKQPSIIGRNHYEVFPDVREQWKGIHQRCLAGAIERSEGEPWSRLDGGTDWVRWEVRPWHRPDDSIGGLIIFSEVITERKEAERHIRSLNRIYAVLSEINQTIVRQRDPEVLLADVCRIAVEIGEFRMAWIGMLDRRQQRIEPRAWAGVEDGYLTARKFDLLNPLVAEGPTATAIREGKHVICNDLETEPRVATWCDELRQRGYRSSGAFPLQVDGELVGSFNLYSGEPEFFDDQEVVLLDELARDISFALEVDGREQARQQAETALQVKSEQLAAMTQQLWQASKLATMGELAASIAHELNNPLTTIALSVESLQLRGDESQAAILQTLNEETSRMATLISNLLQFSRRSHAQISTLNLTETLSSAVSLIDYHLRSRNVKVIRDFAATLPPAQADRQQLMQVFLNLISNATDAMPDGGTLTLRTTARVLENDRPGVAIEFSDSGTGIGDVDLRRIWEPFFTTKLEGKGTGLGLPICRRTVEEHGGTIEVESQPGQGTTFRVTLPAMERMVAR
ncbi:MAG TPA: ATP-binding protein [Pyrinomonadaceae bacterium]|nr:ATP-binding protein [Pyrinomonadaceae bacterium]